MPFEAYLINTCENRGHGIRAYISAEALLRQVIKRHEAIARAGGHVVAQHTVDVRMDPSNHGFGADTELLIVAEFPEVPKPGKDAEIDDEIGIVSALVDEPLAGAETMEATIQADSVPNNEIRNHNRKTNADWPADLY